MSKPKTKLAVFASGTGSNFDAIEAAIRSGELDAEVVLLVSDQPEAKAIEKAKQKNIKTFVFEPATFSSKDAFEQKIVEALKEASVEWVILAGYMRLVGNTLLSAYEGRMLNIHPSLLPSFKGLDAIGQAFDANVKITGVTIHFVDQGMDTGRIIAQEAVAIEPQMTRETLQKRIQEVEHRMYPKTIEELINEGEIS